MLMCPSPGNANVLLIGTLRQCLWYNIYVMTLFPDTTPEAEAILVDLMRQTPGWRKLQMVGQLNRMVRGNLLSGLRKRYPDASEAELRRRTADILLGPELALKVYGPLQENDPSHE